jgi:ubiquinone/menaquinone biosynthesis C-methylase UbiE
MDMSEAVNSWEIQYRKGPTQDRHEPRAVAIDFIQRLAGSGVERILDLGCGDGRHLHYLASTGFEPVGVDYAPTGLRLANDWLGEDGLEAQVVNADMCSIPIREAYFEAVLCIQVLNHGLLADIQRTIGEIARVLAPGGWLCLTVSVWDANTLPEQDFIQIEPNTFLPLVGDEKGVPHHLFTPETLAQAFSAFELPEGVNQVTEHILGLLARKPA